MLTHTPKRQKEQGLFKKAVQQGRRQRGGRGVRVGTLRPPSNENAAGGLFQQPHDRIAEVL